MPPSKQRASKGRKSTKTSMRQKMANMTAKRLASTLTALEPLVTPAQLADPATPNQPTVSSPQVSCSASKRKLSLFQPLSAPSAELPTTITDLSTINQLYKVALCPQCKTPSLQLYNNKVRDRSYAVFLELRCTLCEDTLGSTYTSKKTTIDQSVDCNRRAVLAGLTVGLGHAGLMKLSEGLGMPSMHEKTWRSHLTAIARQTDRIKNDILQQARDRVISYYRETEPDSFDADGVLNIGVSYDGTWAKRGFTSKLGAGAVIDTMTGLVLDFHVMSSHCQLCITVGDPLNIKDASAYKEWLDLHKGSGLCTRNHDGTAGYMEICGAVTMWGRSLNHRMRYTHFVGDGDAKTIAAVNKQKFYGEVEVVKEECVNHVAKRLNGGLRKLITSLSKQNVRLGGNKRGSLTAAKIGLLQSFYTTAVRTYSSSTEEMSKAIWASFFHSISTTDQPQHDNCPTGADSWCFYQRALTKQPFEPSVHEQSTFLNSDVAPHVRKVYERLTDPELLGRCLLGKTQNTNESLHSVIWAKCPKHTFSGLNRVKIGVTLAAGEFNMGSLGSHLFFPSTWAPWAATCSFQPLGAHLPPQRLLLGRKGTLRGSGKLRLPTKPQPRKGGRCGSWHSSVLYRQPQRPKAAPLTFLEVFSPPPKTFSQIELSL
ncbi:hypothetical protein EGW08_022368 [Elysia chlorotica]|uniref:Mutator-like transposase domain-containing protein n=1 Tax=Elysia chlorotica TaxID=188477 RepID=A0A433SL89_ELYCH|nr:hypothetical protein EGW08_022368 [Elysia chlorotica]